MTSTIELANALQGESVTGIKGEREMSPAEPLRAASCSARQGSNDLSSIGGARGIEPLTFAMPLRRYPTEHGPELFLPAAETVAGWAMDGRVSEPSGSASE